MNLAQKTLLTLSMHAKIHKNLDNVHTHYRRLLEKIEEAEIRAYRDEEKFEKIEDLKAELLSIRFTDPSP